MEARESWTTCFSCQSMVVIKIFQISNTMVTVKLLTVMNSYQ